MFLQNEAGRIQLEGTICEDFFKIRQILYNQYAIVWWRHHWCKYSRQLDKWNSIWICMWNFQFKFLYNIAMLLDIQRHGPFLLWKAFNIHQCHYSLWTFELNSQWRAFLTESFHTWKIFIDVIIIIFIVLSEILLPEWWVGVCVSGINVYDSY